MLWSEQLASRVKLISLVCRSSHLPLDHLLFKVEALTIAPNLSFEEAGSPGWLLLDSRGVLRE